MNNLETAIAYAENYGWKSLPVAGKRPLTKHGWKSAGSDPRHLERLFAKHPDAGIAVACRPSGFVAIDIDPRNGGDDHLHELEQTLGSLPETVSSTTGGGGAHYLFANPGIKTKVELAPGVEVKDLGFIVAPPSQHPDTGKEYAWDIAPGEIALQQLPASWVGALQPSNRLCVKNLYASLYTRGQRHAALVDCAARLRGAGLDEGELLAALLAFNQRRCHPPSPGREVADIAAYFAKAGTKPAWKLDPLGYVSELGERFDLKQADRAVLIHLCDGARLDGSTWGGEWLEKKTGLTRPSVSAALGRLVALGLLTKKREPGQKANRLKLNLPTETR